MADSGEGEAHTCGERGCSEREAIDLRGRCRAHRSKEQHSHVASGHHLDHVRAKESVEVELEFVARPTTPIAE